MMLCVKIMTRKRFYKPIRSHGVEITARVGVVRRSTVMVVGMCENVVRCRDIPNDKSEALI